MQGGAARKTHRLPLLLLAGWLCWLALAVPAAAATPAMASDRLAAIEEFVQRQMDKAEIPGLAVVIVQDGQTVYNRSFGYADLEERRPASSDTLYELGSNSKALTSLAVMRLQAEGRLSLEDPVTDYIPWLELTYQEEPREVKLGHLLYHTSGIPFASIGQIPPSAGDDAAETTVRSLLGQELDSEPGSRYEYATINYAVLGLVIESATGQAFADYMDTAILQPLGLDATVAGVERADPGQLSQGYKGRFTEPAAYNPPLYEGNAPSGYILSTPDDVARWLELLLGGELPDGFDPAWLEATLTPDRTVAPSSSGASYAAGWEVYQDGAGEYAHTGSNPAFSSYMAFRPGEGAGVAVLANRNSDMTPLIGQSVLQLWLGKEPPVPGQDLFKRADTFAVALLIILTPAGLIILAYTILALRDIVRGLRPPEPRWVKWLTALAGRGAAAAVAAAALYYLPPVIGLGLSWHFVEVWLPQTVLLAVWLLAAVIGLYLLYSLLIAWFPRRQDRSLLQPVVLAVMSGFGNALIIFVINESFVRSDNLTSGLVAYFGLAVLMYVVGQRYIQSMLVRLTNQFVYEKRMELAGKLLETDYAHMERLERGRVEATLSSDTEEISSSIGLLVTGGTNVVTLLCCFAYLGIMNVYALLLSLVIIAVLAGIYYLVGEKANLLFEETRDIQNRFFGYIADLLRGFKELSLSRARRAGFREAMDESCETFREKRTDAQMRFVHVFIIGETLFVLVIGCVVFLFPAIFEQMNSDMLRSYVFVFLYMTGPVNQLLDSLPQIALIRVSWGRVKRLIREVDERRREYESDDAGRLSATGDKPAVSDQADQSLPGIELRGVVYRYPGETGGSSRFAVGPIDCAFRSGEVTFITGGNGSGKSSLAKLITGLYRPDEGGILLEGHPAAPEELRESFTAIFADFHLFDALYGIDTTGREARIAEVLRLLELDDKVAIEEGSFSTTSLSTGQKKRLALLVAYLEDRPFCLFDEWAADQDPGYRRLFYEQLLPELKAQGKCIIAITHDDAYFDTADRVIKMDTGRLVRST
ncbi:cyclic peptide export ABC transporter [Paenibacillus sp. 1P07SE]|uniref:cyclic peptide export ABC transporter n=1 Tax=Paenibacillus sp. 1P07SE TaxID=3132209 RepID=UPI0039A68619